MNSLAKFGIDAHGGLTRWEQFKEVSADLVQGGVLWRFVSIKQKRTSAKKSAKSVDL